MFKDCISTTPFAGDIADTCFPNIIDIGATFRGDVSLISNTRALMAPYISDEDKIAVYLNGTRPSSSIVDSEIADVFHSILPDFMYDESGNRNKFVILDVCVNNDEMNAALMDKISGNFCKHFKGFKENERTKIFFAKAFPVRVYMDTDRRTTVVFACGLDYARLHYIECLIPAMLPWIHDASNGVSALEKKLMYALTEKDGVEKYKDIMTEMARLYDFRTPAIKNALTGFETVFEKQAIERLKRDIESYQSKIESYERAINEEFSKKATAMTTLFGYEAKIAGAPTTSIADYFLTNKNLVFRSVSGTRLSFGVLGYLTMFDSDMAETVINNRESFVYNYTRIDAGRLSKLLKAIFVDRILRIRVCAKFDMDMGSRDVDAVSHDRYEEYEYRNHLPNPHLHYHSCMNDNRRAVKNAIQSGNYVAAIEQCCYSACNLSWGDTTVMSEFMKIITGEETFGDNKFIELPDGSMVDSIDAIAWLEAQEGAA